MNDLPSKNSLDKFTLSYEEIRPKRIRDRLATIRTLRLKSRTIKRGTNNK